MCFSRGRCNKFVRLIHNFHRTTHHAVWRTERAGRGGLAHVTTVRARSPRVGHGAGAMEWIAHEGRLTLLSHPSHMVEQYNDQKGA